MVDARLTSRRFVKKLLALRAAGDNCALVTKDENSDQYIIILCNAIGTPIDNRYTGAHSKSCLSLMPYKMWSPLSFV